MRIMWDFSALAGSCRGLGVLWAQWEGWNLTAELRPINECVFESVCSNYLTNTAGAAFPGLVNTGIIMTGSVVCGPVEKFQKEMDLHSVIGYHPQPCLSLHNKNVSASVALHAVLSWSPQSRCSSLLLCLRQF